MTTVLGQAISCVISVFGTFWNMCFTTDYPGMTISIGAVLVGFLLIEVGIEYLNFFAKRDDLDSVRYK